MACCLGQLRYLISRFFGNIFYLQFDLVHLPRGHLMTIGQWGRRFEVMQDGSIAEGSRREAHPLILAGGFGSVSLSGETTRCASRQPTTLNRSAPRTYAAR